MIYIYSKIKKLNSRLNFRNVLILLGTFLMFLYSLSPAYADSLQWKKQQLYRVRKNLKTIKKRLRQTNIREKDISRQLHRTQTQIRTLKDDIQYLNSKISTSRSDIRRLRAELADLQKRHSEKQAILQKRLRDIYMHDDNSFLEVLMGSANFSEFINHTDYLSKICEADEQLIKTLRIEQEAIRFKQREINNKYSRMLSYRGRLKMKRTSLENIERKRQELLNEVEKQRRYYQNKKYELEEHTHELEQEVQQMIRAYQRRNRTNSSGSRTAHSTGVFRWPVNGTITSDFGWRVHPVYGTSRYHTGIDIGVPYGRAIKAADGGTVIYSGWCGGYGYTVMIDHGKGIISLYGHCSRLFVSKGQSVAKGQVISAVGSTGVSTGPHLHFEVRQNGVPVSPWGFLR